jgi:hypothetical protein
MVKQAGSGVEKKCVVIIFVTFFSFASARLFAADSREAYDDLIGELARRYQVEPALVKAVIRAESDFDPRAVSSKGARGLMQLTPKTARWHGVSNPQDPRQNIRGGVRFLRALLDRFGNDTKLALAAYNAGGGAVERFGGLPPYRETRRYVATVLRYRARYLAEDRSTPPEPREMELAAALVKDPFPRRAETIWYGAENATDGRALRAALHSPEHRLVGVPPHAAVGP